MRFNFPSILGFFLILFSFGCQSDEDTLPKGDFISFRSEGKTYLFRQIENPSWNKYFRGENQDQIGIALRNEDQSLYAGININTAFIWKKTLPLQISGPLTDPFMPIGDFQLRDLKNQVPIDYGVDDDVNFVGNTETNQIIYILEKYDQDVLEGSFSGTIYTRTGRSMKIESGKFRVRIPVVIN